MYINNYVCCIHDTAYFLLYWRMILYFILQIGTVRSLNFIWIQVGLFFIKKICNWEKVFLFLLAVWAKTRH
jgi:hypothetical protein